MWGGNYHIDYNMHVHKRDNVAIQWGQIYQKRTLRRINSLRGNFVALYAKFQTHTYKWIPTKVTQARKNITRHTKTHTLENHRTQNINNRLQYGTMSEL